MGWEVRLTTPQSANAHQQKGSAAVTGGELRKANNSIAQVSCLDSVLDALLESGVCPI